MDMQEMKSGAEVATQGVNALSKFASTIGEIYYIFGGKAREIRQIADANAYAETIAAETESKVAMIKAQGAEDVAQFVLAKESRKMQNTLSVVEKAEELITPADMATEEPVNQDWLNRFFTIVEDVSDDEMQELWAQILAGEIKQPKSYSLRTLDVLRNMTQEDANLFIDASQYTLGKNIGFCSEKYGLNIVDSAHLAEVGLIDERQLAFKTVVPPNSYVPEILSEMIFINVHNDSDKKIGISTDINRLTKAGKEILKLISPKINESFIKELSNQLKSKGCSKVTKNNIISWYDKEYRFDKDNEVEI